MKKLLWLAFLSFAVFQLHAQEEDKEEQKPQGFDKSKLFFGGNFGLSFGTNTFVNISPQVGYRFNDYFAAGGGPSFIYYSYKNMYGDRYSQGYGGLNVFARVYPIPYVFAQAQPEINYMWGSFKSNGTTHKMPGELVPSLLLGAGGAIPTGGRHGALLVMLQYDAVQAKNSPYGNRAFFTIGYNF